MVGLPAVRTRAQPRVGSVSTAGVTALVATKAADLATTVAGLTLVSDLTEQNPFAAHLVQQFGVSGLVAASAVGVAVVVLVVELTSAFVAASDEIDLRPRTLYLLSYLPLSVVFAMASIHNSPLIASAAG